MFFKVSLATSGIHLHSIILKGQSRRERKDKSDRQNCFKLPLKTHKLYRKTEARSAEDKQIGISQYKDEWRVLNIFWQLFSIQRLTKRWHDFFSDMFLLRFAICILFSNELPHLFVSCLLFCFLQLLLKHLVYSVLLKQDKHLWEHPLRNWRMQLVSKG